MIRVLIVSLTLLHLGPGLAFALFAFGCEGVQPWLGPVCSEHGFRPFIHLTLAAWAVLGLGWAAWSAVLRAHKAGRTAAALRLRWLALVLLLTEGVLLGLVGSVLLSTQSGFVALPILLAAGWLVLARPDDCLPAEHS